MSASLEPTYKIVLNCLKDGWRDEYIKDYVKRMREIISVGDFIPSYEGSGYDPKISYNFEGKILLNRENIKKISDIVRKHNLHFEYNRKNKTAKLFEKTRVRKREIIRITENPEKITVKSPRTIIKSSNYYNRLLEHVGEVFGIEA